MAIEVGALENEQGRKRERREERVRGENREIGEEERGERKGWSVTEKEKEQENEGGKREEEGGHP